MRSVLLVALIAACVDTPPLEEPVVTSSHVEIRELGEGRPPKLDLLIVIDDSLAAAPYQDRLATIPALVAAKLPTLARGWIDARIAVTTNDGWMRRLPGAEDSFLIHSFDLDYTPHQNYVGTLTDALAELTDISALHPGPSQPLAAMRHALETNSQFWREDAALAIVMFSAGDDASPLPAADYAQWTRRMNGSDWGRVVVSSVYPKPAPRLDEYVVSIQAGVRTDASAIDDDDYAGSLDLLGFSAWRDWGSPCLEAKLRDFDGSTPGTQYDCALSAHINDELRAIPQCGVADRAVDRLDFATPLTAPSPACWSLRADPQNCTVGDHLTLRLSGYTDFVHPALHFECRTR